MPGRGFIIFWNFLLFFLEFFCLGRVWRELGTKIWFLSFSAYLIPLWLRIMLGSGFLIFSLFFSIFSCPGRVWTELGTKIWFFSFSAYLIPFWLKIISGIGFLTFWIFLLFFWNFFARVEYERNSGVKFCFQFFGLSHRFLAKNNAGKRFYNFLNVFTLFLGIFLPVLIMNGILK